MTQGQAGFTMSKKSGLPRYVTTEHRADWSPRYVFRKDGRKITLPGPCGSDAFWTAYTAARAGIAPATGKRVAKSLVAKGSLGALVESYFASAAFKAGDKLTQSDKRGVLNSILKEPLVPGKPLMFDTCPVSSITRKHIAVLRDRKAGTPNAANKRLRYVGLLFKWAMDAGLATANPAADVAKVSAPKGGHHTWTVDEIRRYEEKHPIGTMARLAFALIAYAGLRVSDAGRVGEQHLRQIDGEPWLVMPQHKNRTRQAKVLQIPILPELAEVIAKTPRTGLTFLTTQYGVPFSIKGLGNRVSKWCDEAGMPECSAHGMRKAAATIAMDNGGSDATLMAIFGWNTANEVRTYTKARDNRRLARDGIALLVRAQERNKIVPAPDVVEISGTNRG